MLNHKIVQVASKKASARKSQQLSCYAVNAFTASSKADKHVRNNVHLQKKQRTRALNKQLIAS